MGASDETAPAASVELRIRDRRIHCLTAGHPAAPPLVLLHGITGSAEDWRPALPFLGGHLRVYAPDAPGHGRSDKPSSTVAGYDLAYFVAFIHELLDALSLRRPALGALSGGGVPALQFSLEQPDRIGRLVLVAPAGFGREVAWPYRAAALPFARFFLRRATAARIRRFGQRLCYDPAAMPDDWVAEKLGIWRDPAAVEAMLAAVRAGLSWRGQKPLLAGQLAELRVPTLIVWGREDRVLPLAHAYAARSQLPGARLVVFDHCGHLPTWDCPQRFSQAVADFVLDSVQSSPGA